MGIVLCVLGYWLGGWGWAVAGFMTSAAIGLYRKLVELERQLGYKVHSTKYDELEQK